MSDTDIMEGFEEKRSQPRMERIFKVVFQDPEDLKEKYTKDISNGGIFVVSNFQPPVDTIVEVQLKLPDRDNPIQVTGRVAHIVTGVQAAERSTDAGFGVQFIRFFDDDEQLLQVYMEQILNQ
jgi:uncharacterized protein (TIGR02266 family)